MPAISSDPRPASGEPPLVVDLDGTLLRGNLMIESMLMLLRRRPWRLLVAFAWLFRGIAPFKQRIAREMMPDIATLPFDTGLLDYLRRQKKDGRRLILATGADENAASAVANSLGLFDEIIGSDGVRNMTGEAKRDALVARFGQQGFDYAGNGLRDEKVWAVARRAILAGRSARYAQRIGRSVEVEQIFPASGDGLKPYWQSLRPRQWTKNLLVFLPLAISDQLFDPVALLQGIVGWAAFCLCASSGYLFNDLMDLPSDRRHPTKRFRPLAAGEASPVVALALVPALLLCGLAIGFSLSPTFASTVAGYYVLTVSYSLRLKDIAVLDVLMLSGLYTIRLLGGSLAYGVPTSVWLLAFSIFLFLSLALIKRYAELLLMRAVEGAHAHARAYQLQDAELLAALGGASGYVAGLVLVLFHVGRQVPGTIDLAGWIICLIYLYWISHMWLMAHRGVMQDDPLTFALRERTSRILLALAAVTFMTTWLR